MPRINIALIRRKKSTIVFNELDSAVVSLADYIEKKPESNGFTRFDILLDGQYSSWISLPIRCVCVWQCVFLRLIRIRQHRVPERTGK